ncbi:succinylglutamate desuccinylase/aspartoacylase domain-containing protein [Neptuniibacter halophilus]|uniref:succinylglutamate desuccinylase/aspartoacylase domain-containing protein n=1 Tax=Neptuniibacter halophilus TaxID=651666 RepID=UPI002573389A|nr:succinylglutamate desuccinylase/aspartoacylase family protein [Neptuniibacter halophilus]
MKQLINPTVEQLGETPEAFLRLLGEPCMIYVEGEERTRTRGLVTLLHGNEPSGLRALHRWLRQGRRPCCNLLCFIPAVEAALLDSLHKHRVYPGERDMNRCFFPPYEDRPGKVAEEIVDLFEQYQPEAVLDIHNTSGHSPDFAVVTYESEPHEALVSLFCDRLVITDLRLGALMERSSRRCPVVTIECGGAADEAANEVAWQGLQRYLHQPEVLQLEHGKQMDIYRHPVRLELIPGTVVAFAEGYVIGTDLTVPADLDRHNFGTVERGTLIGWLGSEAAERCLRVHNAKGEDVGSRLFEIHGNQLVTAVPLKLFMITTRPDIALSDCLLYAAEEREHEILKT